MVLEGNTELSQRDDIYGIIVFGANGSGKTTLARELSHILGYKHIDHEEYAFIDSDIPYTKVRSKTECIELMLEDIYRYRNFVLSAVTGDFGERIERFYRLAIHIELPLDIRITRIKEREYKKYDKRVLEGGDLYENTQRFIDFVRNRSEEGIDEWRSTLSCPLLSIDGAADYINTALDIVSKHFT